MKKIKSIKELPEWYPLKIYETDLSLDQWHFELSMRLSVQTVLENTNDIERARKLFDELVIYKTNVKSVEDQTLFRTPKNIFEAMGVKNITVFQLIFIASYVLDTKKGKDLLETINKFKVTDIENINPEDIKKLAFEEKDLKEAGEEDCDIPDIITDSKLKSPFDWIDDDLQEFVHLFYRDAILSIDLDHDDESLKEAFEFWLAGVREITGESKKPFSDTEFAKWRTYKILPAYDLNFWAKLHGKSLTDNVIANALWPYSEVDIVDRYRKVTKPRMNDFFKDFTFFNRLSTQVELNKSFIELKKFVEKHKE